ncbi:hypothetical protein L1049_026719 [Liquidambar formosana]|uniref:Uncharacterized protein n=1 Tax=Liquidambar formosana TaxID=63359 RepID=A0AAP0NG22_LIQFO
MEGVEFESKDEPLKSQIAIRCAKAALLLSSLKSFPSCTLRSPHHDEDEEREILMRAVADLKLELVKERMKSRRIKLCSLTEVLLQVMVMLSLWSFCLMFVFNFY